MSEAIIKQRVTFTFFGVTLESSGTNCVVIQVQSGLGVPQLELQQRLVPPEVRAEGGALGPLVLSVRQKFSTLSTHFNVVIVSSTL